MDVKGKRGYSVKTLALVGILSALVFALSKIQIPIGTGDSGSRIHLGNIMCILGGLLFGPAVGGLSAGLGSMIFDLTDPRYVSEFWITFATKFVLGFLPGLIMVKAEYIHLKIRILLASLSGMIGYMVLYLAKSAIVSRFITGLPWEGVWPILLTKFISSGINGLIAVVACYFLGQELRTALKRSSFLDKNIKGA